MQYVACVKLVGIELAVILPVQYDIRKCSSWTRYRRGEERVSRSVHVRSLCPPAMSTACLSTLLFSLVILTCSQRGFCSHGTGETQHEVVDVLSALSGSVLCDVQNLDMMCKLQLGQSYFYIYSNDATMHFELLKISNCLKRRTYRCRNTVQETC